MNYRKTRLKKEKSPQGKERDKNCSEDQSPGAVKSSQSLKTGSEGEQAKEREVHLQGGSKQDVTNQEDHSVSDTRIESNSFNNC